MEAGTEGAPVDPNANVSLNTSSNDITIKDTSKDINLNSNSGGT